MPLNQLYLQELSENLLENLRRSDYYRQLPKGERRQLENHLEMDAEGGGLPLLPGADPDDLENLQDALEEELGVELPPSAMEILLQVDGFKFNGVVLYGVDPELRADNFDSGPGVLAETSYQWTTYLGSAEAYLFLGDSDLRYYVIELNGAQAAALDRTNLAVAERFESTEEMVNEMLRSALNVWDEAS